MKKLFVAATLFFAGFSAHADPMLLLQCTMVGAPIETAAVYSYAGRMILITRPIDGDGVSRVLREEEWEKRSLYLARSAALTGVLYREGNIWRYTFKDSDGWRTMGEASCSEASY